MEKTILQIMSEIQSKLKAPKNQFNNFGKYNYRNLEDILEALKPLLKEHAAVVTINDEIVQIGERYYIKATAALFYGDASISAVAYARESESKKGMDDAQVTGSTSSYARKYAMNGLFAIDDTKDADSPPPSGGNNNDVEKAEKTAQYLADCDKNTTLDDLKKWWTDNSAKIKKDLGQAQATAVYNHMRENKKILEDI
jgi:hypothetical protein